MAADGTMPFFLAEQWPIVRPRLSTPVSERLHCLHDLAEVNSAAVNFGVHAFLPTTVLSRYIPGGENCWSF